MILTASSLLTILVFYEAKSQFFFYDIHVVYRELSSVNMVYLPPNLPFIKTPITKL